MQTLFGKIISIAIVGLFVFTSFYNSNLYNYSEETSEKNILLQYSYSVLDDYFENSNNSVEPDYILEEFGFDYHKIFLTILSDGSIRGCQSGSAGSDESNRLYKDIKEATIECIEDKRFGGILTEEEYTDVTIVFTFLYNKQKLENNDLDFLEENIELGIHAIEVDNDGDSAYFKDSVPISKNYDLDYTLERLCKKAGLDDDAWKNADTSIYKYDTISFVGNRDNTITDLYRYNTLINLVDIDNNLIKERISLGKNWFLNSIDSDTNLLEYMYYPSKDSYSSSNNDVRQIACLWSMTELDLFFKTDLFDKVLEKTLDYYLKYKENSGNYSYLKIDGYSKLAYNAFMILVLVNFASYENRDVLLDELAEGILSLQNEDGSYDTYFNSNKNSGVDFYPGEAMLALMKLYGVTHEDKYLDSVKKAYPYYIDYWRDNKNTAFVPWHSQVYWLLFQEIEDLNLAEFVFEMNDWLIENYQITENEYPDKIGGFPKTVPRYSTSSYLEGINDAYSLAVAVNDEEHIQKYAEAISLGTRFILQTQFTDENSFYLENPAKAIGGFKKSLFSNELRNDYTQHGVAALIKVYKNRIFN